MQTNLHITRLVYDDETGKITAHFTPLPSADDADPANYRPMLEFSVALDPASDVEIRPVGQSDPPPEGSL